MIADDDLFRRQEALQTEADKVMDRLQLMPLLNRVGRTIVVGSKALGLMVWRDVDIEIYCPALSPDPIFEAIRPLASVPGIYRLHYHDYSGPRSVPEVPDGYYWGIRYQLDGDPEWKFDLWFVAEHTTHRMGLEALSTLPPRLTVETVRSILRLKTLWFEHPSYRKVVYSTDIYDAVLEHGVRTPDQLERYLQERGKLS